ncbi:unnamed protein product [Ambrosiozyma monospora]|uniref:Unnamed protein product n=1 Tax=Ambrosiozyma monospora TaxID=43982 RepID=A0ACB5SRS9_AMBMO|nr:unnamed protein product [Ambrosiozyma monospora]
MLMRRPLGMITELLYESEKDEVFEEIMVMVINELVFDSMITETPSYERFVDFIIDRSIEIRIVSSGPIYIESGSMRLLEEGCCDLNCDYQGYMDSLDPSSFAFVTSLTCDPLILQNIMMETDFAQMKRLTKLKIVLDDSSISEMGMFRDERLLREMMIWKLSGEMRASERRLILSLKFCRSFPEKEVVSDINELANIANYEFQIHSSSTHTAVYPPLGLFHELLTKHVTNAWVFRTSMGKYGRKTLKEVNEHKKLKELHLQFLKSEKTDQKPVTFSNPFLETISLHSFRVTNSNVHFKNLLSLKKFCLKKWSTSFDILNSLPETLERLTIDNVTLIKTKSHAVNLPIYLRTLAIYSQSNSLSTFEIANASQLVGLSDVYIALEESLCSDTQLNPFIHSLPLSVNRLQLNLGRALYGDDIGSHDGTALCLNELHRLNHFLFSYYINSDREPVNYNLSNLPSCNHLELKNFASFGGQFSDTLESLTINLWDLKLQFRESWKNFISPLENLYYFNASIIEYGDIDFRGLKFPEHLETIELISHEIPCLFSFDYFPDSLISFYYECPPDPFEEDYFIQFIWYEDGTYSFNQDEDNTIFYVAYPYTVDWRFSDIDSCVNSD